MATHKTLTLARPAAPLAACVQRLACITFLVVTPTLTNAMRCGCGVYLHGVPGFWTTVGTCRSCTTSLQCIQHRINFPPVDDTDAFTLSQFLTSADVLSASPRVSPAERPAAVSLAALARYQFFIATQFPRVLDTGNTSHMQKSQSVTQLVSRVPAWHSPAHVLRGSRCGKM